MGKTYVRTTSKSYTSFSATYTTRWKQPRFKGSSRSQNIRKEDYTTSFGTEYRVHKKNLFPDFDDFFPNRQTASTETLLVLLNQYLTAENVLSPEIFDSLKQILKSITIHQPGNILWRLLSVVEVNQVSYPMWEGILNGGDWYATTVPVLEVIPENHLETYLLKQLVKENWFSQDDFLKVLSEVRPVGDKFALPYSLLKTLCSY